MGEIVDRRSSTRIRPARTEEQRVREMAANLVLRDSVNPDERSMYALATYAVSLLDRIHCTERKD